MKNSRLVGLALAGLLPVAGALVLTFPARCAGQSSESLKPGTSGFDKSKIFGRDTLSEAAKNFRQSGKATHSGKTSFVVVGEVNCPGEFELDGETDILNALLAAGGPGLNGSFRRLEVYLHDQLLAEFDLYDYLLGGHLSNDFVLNGGEVIKVPAAGPLIKAAGLLKQSGIFEVQPSELRVDRLVQLCGGATGSDTGYRVEILRNAGGYRRAFLSVETEAGEDFPALSLQDGDEVVISQRLAAQMPVSLEGCVNIGKIPFREGMRLSEVLANGNCLKSDTAHEYGEVLRVGADKKVYEAIGFAPGALVAGDLSGDFTLRPADRVIFFSRNFLDRNRLVFIEGVVKAPGKFSLGHKMSIKNLIDMAGGAGDSHESLGAELARREIKNGKLHFSKTEVNLKAVYADDPRHNIELKPFDSLRIFRR
ncbi:MAG TPA: SLBB domain-containing protein [Candidatus Rifleibacterium sp.]|nr:SLBB domain-containing protein [Candidatus Rifleibacterium sp.]HPT45307.1 SLBB domain-containing protein [Candidatus Rifleibacterium sp.]